MFDNMIENKTIVRLARNVIDIFSHKILFKLSVSGLGSQVHLSFGDTVLSKVADSLDETGMKIACKLIEDSGKFIRIRMKWVKHIQANWLIYIVCAAIIWLCILFFYCMGRMYFARRRNVYTSFISQLSDIDLIMANNTKNHNSKNANASKQLSCGTISEPNSINN